jgi:hypothetical protein
LMSVDQPAANKRPGVRLETQLFEARKRIAFPVVEQILGSNVKSLRCMCEKTR